MSIFSEAEIKRYNRHLILPEVGLEGQRKLKDASVLLIGAGGLGSPTALYLAAAGVGRIGIVDFDLVDESNLQRQVLHGTSNLGKLKTKSAQIRLTDLNPHIKIETFDFALTNENTIELFKTYDVVVDGTDNFPTRYLINDACVLTGKPMVYASIYRFEGQLSVFNYENGPCYRCLYSEAPAPGIVPSCAEGGVMGVLPGVIGSMQANEVLKILVGIGKPAAGRIIVYDSLELKMSELKLNRNPECAVCGDHPTVASLIDYDEFCGIHKPEIETSDLPNNEIDVHKLKIRRDLGEKFILLDVREDFEYDICHIDGSVLIPLSELDNRISELNPDDDYVVMCKLGGRSARAVDFLEQSGFSSIKNLVGGIIEWIDEIDDSLAKY